MPLSLSIPQFPSKRYQEEHSLTPLPHKHTYAHQTLTDLVHLDPCDSVLTYVHMLFQLDLGLSRGVDLVFLSLKVIQGLLVGLLQSFLLLGQLGDDLIQPSHLLCPGSSPVGQEPPSPPGSDITNLGDIYGDLQGQEPGPRSGLGILRLGLDSKGAAFTLFSVACFSFSTLARVSSRSSMSLLSSEHSSSSLALLGSELSVHLLLVLQPFGHLLHLCLQLDLVLDQLVTALLSARLSCS